MATATKLKLHTMLGNYPITKPLKGGAVRSDLVDFDSARGIVKFKSDVTFSPGSSELTGQARTGISRFSVRPSRVNGPPSLPS